MRRTALTLLLVVLGPLMLTSCFHDPVSLSFEGGFEGGDLSAWQTGADVPEDPNNPGNPVAWAIEASSERAETGQRSARFFLDGRQDDGTIWLARPFDVPPNAQLNVSLSFQLWSQTASMANEITQASVYAGPSAPQAESDFNTERPGYRVAGWDAYRYQLAAQSGSDGQLWVAVGINVVWETEVTHYLDDVQIEMEQPGLF
ncbi:MAG: hypothetical protein ABEK03_02670 [Candidatus Bipolaricaulia bacterium]